MSNTIRETMMAEAPKFAADFVEYYENFYKSNVEELGRRWLRNAYDGRRDRWNHVIVRCFKKPEHSMSINEEYGEFDRDVLVAMGEEYGERMATEWATKIEAKLEAVEGVSMRNMGRGDFTFVGTRNGRKISVSQQTVTKVSNKGKWFHQFPARIYVDGKFTSEKDYKAMFATEESKAAEEAAPKSHRESFTAKRTEDGRVIRANAFAYDRQRELKEMGIRSRVTGDARYATISYKM